MIILFLSFVPYPSLNKHPTWHSSDIKTFDLNLMGRLWRFLYLRCHIFVQYPLHKFRRKSSFLIYVCGIFLSLRLTITYPRTVSMYNIFLSIYSPFISTMYLTPCLSDLILTTFPTNSVTNQISAQLYWLKLGMFLHKSQGPRSESDTSVHNLPPPPNRNKPIKSYGGYYIKLLNPYIWRNDLEI